MLFRSFITADVAPRTDGEKGSQATALAALKEQGPKDIKTLKAIKKNLDALAGGEFNFDEIDGDKELTGPEAFVAIIQMIKKMVDAFNNKGDMKTAMEALEDFGKGPKYAQKMFKASQDYYKQFFDKENVSTDVNQLLKAYVEPGGKKANELLTNKDLKVGGKNPSTRYRIEAQAPLMTYLDTQLGNVGIVSIKKGLGNSEIIRLEDREIKITHKEGKLQATITEITDEKGKKAPIMTDREGKRSEERRGGKECRSRWSPDH